MATVVSWFLVGSPDDDIADSWDAEAANKIHEYIDGCRGIHQDCRKSVSWLGNVAS